MLTHGAFVVIDFVMYTTYDRNKYCDGCFRTIVPAFVCFYYLSFVNAFILGAINIHTRM